ncbi:exopolysaccharide biosynthesis protein [Rhizobium sullae]|uniref:Exopolysaccharide biosynthesis protein n=1 Tax=Rhizobium sullae TaxID=50338 RepID=A0A2N0D756_RHISU|nr:exopolysaccharide biosynthesis protein [Rhizobium sullae]
MTIEGMERSRRHFVRGPRPKGRRLSAILRQLAGDRSRERISIGDLFEVMGDRATGALMLVFAIPNLVPTPPGTSSILGAPLLFLASQLTFGLKPWLPKVIAGRSMRREDFEVIVSRIHRWLAFAERMLQPRLSFLVEPPAEYLAGFLCLVLAIILTLPIPLGNILPAFAICLFSFGILGRDGLFSLFGMIMAGISLTVVGGVSYGLIKAAIFFVTNWFA